MSEKEYKVEYHNDYVTIREVEYDTSPAETDPNPTFREELGEKIRSTSKTTKIILTLFFNIYGILYRFGCNKTTAVIFSFIHFAVSVSSIPLILESPYYIGSTDYCYVLIPLAMVLLIQLIDLISVIATGDIVFLKMKKYKNYWER